MVGSGAVSAEQLRRQPRFGDQRRFDLVVDLPPHRAREQDAGDAQRQDGRGQRRDEELCLERGARRCHGDGSGSSSL